MDLAVDPVVGGEQMRHRMVPGQVLQYPCPSDPAHPGAGLGVVDQLGQFRREIGGAIGLASPCNY